MRVYALLLGTLLTAGSVAATGLAVTSATVARSWRPDAAAPGVVWYGGTLDPVIVLAPRATAPTLAAAGDAFECPRYHAPHAGSPPTAAVPAQLVR